MRVRRRVLRLPGGPDAAPVRRCSRPTAIRSATEWLWAHNGAIREFARVKRDLLLAVDPALFLSIVGSTDFELMFYLALTFGLRTDPVAAVERMVGFVEDVGRAHGVPWPIQMTVATTGGERLWVFRYSSEGQSRTLFYSTMVSTLRQLHPEVAQLRELADEMRLVVSEPLSDLPGVWVQVPESSYGIVQPGQDVMEAFHPNAP